MTGAALAVCSVLTIIAAVHLYWAAGGTTWKGGAIPSRDGVPVLSPSSAVTALVGVALLGTAAVVGSTAGLLPRFLPTGLLRGASAVRDTYLYSPLCLLLAVLIALVALT